jgi:hypothetical protein
MKPRKHFTTSPTATKFKIGDRVSTPNDGFGTVEKLSPYKTDVVVQFDTGAHLIIHQRKLTLESATLSPPPTATKFKIGDRVSHPTYGFGVVQRLSPNRVNAGVLFDCGNLRMVFLDKLTPEGTEPPLRKPPTAKEHQALLDAYSAQTRPSAEPALAEPTLADRIRAEFGLDTHILPNQDEDGMLIGLDGKKRWL